MTAFGAMMRARSVLVGPAVALACAVAPGGAAQSVTPGATSSPAPAAAQGQGEAAREAAPAQQPAGQVDPAAGLLAEVQAMDLAARWAWAVAVMPELVEHREGSATPERWAEFRRLAAGRSKLWVRARGDRCFSVRGAWEDDGFFGRAREVAEIEGDVKTVRFEAVEITASGISTSGPHGDVFARDARGRWQTDGVFGLGSFATLAERPVFEVTRKAAYYGEAAYTLTIECGEKSAQEERCSDGSTRRCSRCTGLWARPHAPGQVWAGGRMSVTGASDRQVDCSVACPADLLTEQLPALNLAVQGRTFVTADVADAAVYLDAGTCRADRRLR
ncbi:hypothetical protein OV203_11415 [Nannocystis sp. ILAH1]|uniref:hypothetical protein n=1 Tax=Nannocystis sp. ILAH1 TaxID=2996789 RepID=UPI00226E868D|nr:hypothetical protein [Nannocystis sp. ILAH1]MCY0987737.1 hypothetical protein [Nannocystis sp. ILAH1]